MTTAIVEYSSTEAALSDLAQRYKDVIFDVSTSQGMVSARKGRAEIRILRTSLEAKRVEIKAPALERCRLIDAEAKRITAELLALETPIDTLIKNEEQRKEREKAERERIEAERVASIRAQIDGYAQVAVALSGQSSARVADAIAKMELAAIGEWAAEFAAEAQTVKDAALGKLRGLHASALAHEAEQERIKAEREELARLRAEQNKRAAEEQARIYEETRKRAESEAAARAKIEAEERAARERIEAEERKARLAREEEDRKARAAREAEEREAKRLQAEEDARLKTERDRVEAERRAIEERERKAREAEEAKQREMQREQNELLDAYAMLVAFKARFGHRKEFAKVIAQIDAMPMKQRRIPHRRVAWTTD